MELVTEMITHLDLPLSFLDAPVIIKVVTVKNFQQVGEKISSGNK